MGWLATWLATVNINVHALYIMLQYASSLVTMRCVPARYRKALLQSALHGAAPAYVCDAVDSLPHVPVRCTPSDASYNMVNRVSMEPAS